MAAERHAFENTLNAVIEECGLNEDDDALLDAWDALHPPTADDGKDKTRHMSVSEAIAKMPYDFSPARLRCMQLELEMSAHDSPAT